MVVSIYSLVKEMTTLTETEITPYFYEYQHLTLWMTGKGVSTKYRDAIFRTFLSDPEYYGNLSWQEIMDRTFIPAFPKGDN